MPRKKKKVAKKKAAKRRKPGQRYLELKKLGETHDGDVIFQIAQQSHRETFHPEGEDESFRASNDIRIVSSSHPQWESGETQLYVRGCDKYMDDIICVAESGYWDDILLAVEEYNAWVINTHWSTAFRDFDICSEGKAAMRTYKKPLDWFMAGLTKTACCEWLRDGFRSDYNNFGKALHKALTMKSGPLPKPVKAAKKAAKKKKKAKKKARRR